MSISNINNADLALIENFNREKRYEDNWEEPIYFDTYELPSFKVSVFPPWLRNYLSAVAETSQTPIDMACIAAISILSIGAAKNFYINPYGDWVEPLNTYCLTLMGPANRKSSVFRLLSSPVTSFEKMERDRLESDLTKRNAARRSLTRRIDHLEGVYAKEANETVLQEIFKIQKELDCLPELHLPTFITDDSTPETLVSLMQQNRERIGVLSAEAGIFDMIKGRYSGQVNLEVYLKGHTGDYLRVDRRGRTEIIESPALTIGILGQNDVIKQLPAVFQSRGLMARFLYSIPKDYKGYINVRPSPIQEDVRQQFNNKIKLLMNLRLGEPVVLTLDQKADELFKDFQELCEQQLREGELLSIIPEWGGKLAGNIARITGLLHIADQLESDHDLASIPKEVSIETVYKAIMLKDYYIQNAQAAFGSMKQNTGSEDVIFLLDTIKRRHIQQYNETGKSDCPVAVRDIQQRVKNRFDSKRLKILLKELEERGFIRAFFDSRDYGKPKQYLMINPLWLKTYPNIPKMDKTLV
ncbi:YfjI family protein [Cytobacillus firmus]|uniref:YfjI family protein n=1 Tax=Cytobacillus firmus TaxID=1399 RepID=UPI0018CEE6C0|nr:YfjI family protein [Cytobacillus firmus]